MQLTRDDFPGICKLVTNATTPDSLTASPRLISQVDHDPSAPAPWLSLLWEMIGLLAIFAVISGGQTPDLNEAHYLTKAKHYWNPAWCPEDHFLNSLDAHQVFYYSLGWLTLWFDLPTTAWIGRMITWSLLAWVMVPIKLEHCSGLWWESGQWWTLSGLFRVGPYGRGMGCRWCGGQKYCLCFCLLGAGGVSSLSLENVLDLVGNRSSFSRFGGRLGCGCWSVWTDSDGERVGDTQRDLAWTAWWISVCFAWNCNGAGVDLGSGSRGLIPCSSHLCLGKIVSSFAPAHIFFYQTALLFPRSFFSFFCWLFC